MGEGGRMTPVDVARWIMDRCALILAARLTRRLEDVEALAVEAHRTALDALALAREHAKEPKRGYGPWRPSPQRVRLPRPRPPVQVDPVPRRPDLSAQRQQSKVHSECGSASGKPGGPESPHDH
jgi:hypothetical protein